MVEEREGGRGERENEKGYKLLPTMLLPGLCQNYFECVRVCLDSSLSLTQSIVSSFQR